MEAVAQISVGTAHQKIVRDRLATEDPAPLGLTLPVKIERAVLQQVSFQQAKSIILQYEYLGTMPSGFRCAYGIFWQGYCGGVVVCGSPNPMQIANSVFGGKWQDQVMQIHRGACVWWAHQHSASRLIGYTMRELSKENKWRIAIAFADPNAGEIGTVYQATNWLYCGWTAKRPDYVDAAGKRKVGNFQVKGAGLTRIERPRKRRYVALLGNRRLVKESRRDLKWPVLPYEKRA